MTRTERQLQIIKKWKEYNCRAIMVCPTGFGKTQTAITAIQLVQNKNPAIKVKVVVPTIVLKEQWQEKIDLYQIKNVEILVLNTAAKKSFECGMLVVDEIHKAVADQMIQVFNNCNPRFILGATATYERLDGKEKILNQYLPICDTVTIEEALENGWLSPYREYKVLLNVDLTEYNKANTAFLSSFSFFNFDWNLAMNCVSDLKFRQNYAKKTNFSLKEVSARAFTWNRALQFRKKFIADHPYKIEIAKKILQARQDKKCITFNGSIKQCEAYENGLVLHSQKKSKENKEILQKFNLQNIGVLHTSKMANEGLDIKGLSIAVITGFNSSKISNIQRIGRVIRKEEDKQAEVFYLILKGTVEEKWFAKANEGMDFIPINEQELDTVLKTNIIDKETIKQDVTNGFRY